MIDRHVPVFATALLALVLAACGQGGSAPAGSADDPPASAEVPAGWEVHESGNFSLALPEGWQPFDAETFAESGVFDQMVEENPELASVMEQAQAGIESGQVDFVAMELGTPAEDGFAENVNIGESEYSGSVEALESAAVSEIEAGLPTATGVESEATQLPAGDAVRLRYQYPLQTPAGDSFNVVVTQYMILGDGSMHIVTFSATDDVIAKYESTFETIAESFTTTE